MVRVDLHDLWVTMLNSFRPERPAVLMLWNILVAPAIRQ
jgi:hypothetical protein